MKISLAGILLADATAGLPPIDLKHNGSRVVEIVDFARASSKGFFFRGNGQSTITFSVSRVYGNYADAQDAFFLAEALAPTQGPLLVRQTGADANRPPVGATNAVLASVVPELQGVRVDVAYTIQAGRLAGGNALPYASDPSALSLMVGTTNIPSGQDFVAVNFPGPLNNPVITGANIVPPGAGLDTPGVWHLEQVTGTAQGGNGGFIAHFTGPVPAVGYSLHWAAQARPVA